MNSKKRLVTAALFSTFVLGLLLLAVAAPCRAQAIASPNGEYLIGADTAGTGRGAEFGGRRGGLGC